MNLKKTLATIVLGAALLPGCGSGPKPPEPQPSLTQTAVLENDVNIRYNATLTNTTSATREKYHDNSLVETRTIDIPNYMQILTDNEKGIYRFVLKATGATTQTNTVEVPNYDLEYTCTNDPIILKDKYEESQVNLDLEGCLTDKNPEDRPVNVTSVEFLTGNLKLDHVGNTILIKAVEETEGESMFRVNYENANGDTDKTDFNVTTEKIPYQMAFWKSFGSSSTSFIYSANINGAGEIPLTEDQNLDFNPRYSPDGTKIAFFTNRDGVWKIYLMNADGTDEHAITNGMEDAIRPDWSPDGTKIAFGYRNFDNPRKTGVAVINSNGSGSVNRLVKEDYLGFWVGSPNWSPDGTKIAFDTHRDGDWEIYMLNADGTGLEEGRERLTDNPSKDVVPVWSPDGTKIAFTSDRDNLGSATESNLFLLNVGTSDLPARLTSMVGMERDPDWSYDGTNQIFFTNEQPLNNIDSIWKINIDGTGLNLVITSASGENAHPTFRRNNPKIVP